jgi:DNA polymerase-3 subunit alpha
MLAPLDKLLGETYGLLVYQEQVMQIAQKLAGYSLGAADLLRRAMGKKKKSKSWTPSSPTSSRHEGQRLLLRGGQGPVGDLVPFSDYAFNKAHAAAYGLVSYWTAYLKANYPAEYMAALLDQRA